MNIVKLASAGREPERGFVELDRSNEKVSHSHVAWRSLSASPPAAQVGIGFSLFRQLEFLRVDLLVETPFGIRFGDGYFQVGSRLA